MMQSSFAVNPLAPSRPSQTTTHVVRETSMTGAPQVQSQMSYQQYAQPAPQYAPSTTQFAQSTTQYARPTTQYTQATAQYAQPATQYSAQGTAPYIQQAAQGATQYLQQSTLGATQYLQQASAGVSQYLQQQPPQGASQYIQQASQGATQYLQQAAQGASQYVQQASQVANQYAQQPTTVEYTQPPTTYTQSAELRYSQPAAPTYTQTTTQYRSTSQGTPAIQYQVAGGSSQSYGQSQLPTIMQSAGITYPQGTPEGRGFHSFAKAGKGPGSSAFVSGPVPDATPMVTSGSTGTIIPRQQPYAFTTVTYAKTKSSAKEEVDPNFKNSYLSAQAEGHAMRERPVHPMPTKASAGGCC